MLEEEKDEQEEQSAGKGKLKLIIIIVGAVLVLGGGGFGAYALLSGSPAEDGHDAGDSHGTAVAEESHGGGEGSGHGSGHGVPGHALGPLHEMDSFVVNLADKDTSRYLKTTLHLELGNPELGHQMEGRTPQIRDAIISLLSSKSFDDVADVKGKVKLRKEIILRLNDILGDGAVTQVFFTDFIVQ